MQTYTQDQRIITLPNGIRVVHKPSPGNPVTHCCLVINAGSRDEEHEQAGTAHLIEHLLFKGTQKRSSHHILNRLEVVGADINAYTTKEHTCIHASFLNKHSERALDLITDIIFNSTFPEKEIVKEKGVILDELYSYMDSPEEQIQDDFDLLVYKDHTMGNNILGTPETINSLNRKNLMEFIRLNYISHNMVLGIYGDLNSNQLERLASKYLGHIPNQPVTVKRIPLSPYTAALKREKKAAQQAHAIIGNRCYDIKHPNKIPMFLLNNLLGGPGMNSTLNMNIREKHGIAYSIESSYSAYSDTGLFAIYMGTDIKKMDKCIKLVHKELATLINTSLSPRMLVQAKQKLIGQIALAEENRMGVIIAMAKNLLDHGHIEPLEEIITKIENTNAQQLQDIAKEIFVSDQLSTLIFEPEN